MAMAKVPRWRIIRRGRRLGCCGAAALLLAGANAVGGPATQSTLYQFGYDPKPDFIAFDPHYRQVHDQFSKQLDALQADMIRQQRAGRKTPCSRQVFLECRWLVYYTDDQAQTRQRLMDLQKLLSHPKDPHPLQQDQADGSFAPCCNAWWLKMDMTTDQLITMSYGDDQPQYPLKFLDRINSPQKLRAYLDSLLISDIRRTGVNNALELNMAAADLQRLILWHGTPRALPSNYDFDPNLKAALLDYEDHKWQDPQTGMWGAWYRAENGAIVKTADLSTTFHLVGYRNGQGIAHWPELINTTLAMRQGRFPFGWLEEGRFMSNHHNMDLARLWRLGWPHAAPQQREQIAAAISAMLDFCLHQSLQADGSFKAPEEDTLSSAFYFGVGFLHEIGYFTSVNRFWTDRKFPDAREVHDRIHDRIRQLGLDDSEAQWTMGMLLVDRP